MRQRHRAPVATRLLAAGGHRVSDRRARVSVRLPGHDPGRQGHRHGPRLRGRRRRSVGDLLQPGRHRVPGSLLGRGRRRGPRAGRQRDFTGANPYPGVGATSGASRSRSSRCPNLYMVVPADHGAEVRPRHRRAVRPRPALERPRELERPVHLAERGHQDRPTSTRCSPTSSCRSSRSRPARTTASRGSSSSATPSATDPFTQAEVDVAHTKLYSNLTSNGGWGYNAAILWKPAPGDRRRRLVPQQDHGRLRRHGDRHARVRRATRSSTSSSRRSYRSACTRSRRRSSFRHPSTRASASTSGGGFTLGLEADWTEWSSFKALNINFPDGSLPTIDRSTVWKDSWAYRVGLEKTFGAWAIRVGYYYDNTPQPDAGRRPDPGRQRPQRLHGRLRLQHAAVGHRRRRRLHQASRTARS